MLAALVGLQALLAVSVVYLPFLFSISTSFFSLTDSALQLTVASERISYAAACEMMMSGPRLLEAESDGSHHVQPLQTYSLHLARDSCRDGIYD